ncbi:MAG: ABC transporter ATP-binding protein [Deltaproteobacteria bacterium]|nr:ABC transporter ATP-binding protein [Deltaproteobacteria bacterium]MBI2181145.1 ABC transporter ATP-binding protein [Deltaproteobacteria bacterium]MBI2365393.1 ABC transporter ATP-binding protein [Deltaproteobacteria bacterium]MBI2530888.1 ABC transporter ATP-binding protein [Deltaproteobacteria bacterium]MBI3063576.1 ABC transporter ATP-binding protein [Deltaproteobacteria bacterium]
MEPLILLEELTKNYDGKVLALDRVSLQVYPGEWVAVMGASGSGKSTLLNMIAALDRPTSGSVWVNGEDVLSLSEEERARFRREKVGLIFQHFYLIPYLTALENVMLAQYFHSMADREEAAQAVHEVGLEQRMSHYPSELSGGEQQRVCIARALINQPKILLADEPTGNLDAENEEIVIAIFRRLHRAGLTLLFVTHDPQIGTQADRIVELEHGRILPTFPAKALRSI